MPTPVPLPIDYSRIEPLGPTGTGRGRYQYVDALRGFAAVVVVLFHVTYVTPLKDAFAATLPRWFTGAASVGDRGVEVFFVISGFVIAHSLRRVPATLAGAGNFILRRQLRLDPPYWTVLAATVALAIVENHVRGFGHPSVPRGRSIVLNMLYVQHIVQHYFSDRIGNTALIVGVAWTLCLEIQFYLLFMLLTWVGTHLSRARDNPSKATVWLVVITGAGCLAFTRHQLDWVQLAIWAPGFWPYFAFGAVAYYATHHRLPWWGMALYTALFTTATVLAGSMWSHMLVGLLTASSLYIGGKTGGLWTWGSAAVVQYFGRLSYSLYLVHLQVAYLIGTVANHHPPRSAIVSWMWLAVCVAASIGVADVLHRLVEKPSMRWASQFKGKRHVEREDVKT